MKEDLVPLSVSIFLKIIKEQGNVEAFELLELTNKVHCTHCDRYVTSGHVYSCCGPILGKCKPKSRYRRSATALLEVGVRLPQDLERTTSTRKAKEALRNMKKQ